MDIGTLLGLILCFSLVFGSIAMGTGIAGFIDVPSMIIVAGGTFSVTFVMFPVGSVIGSLKAVMKAFLFKSPDPLANVRQIIQLAETARRESLVALEKVNVSDQFLQRGILLVADGTEETIVRSVMETEIANMVKRHKSAQSVFKAMGTYSPAFGLIGTLIGLVQMLQNLNDPSSIGPAMAVALLTTFYGALLANVLFSPLANKLAERSSEESQYMEMTMEGVLAILNGEHPSVIKEKLASFLPPKAREK